MKNDNRRSIPYVTITVAIILIAIVVISTIFSQLYQVSRTNIINLWENNTSKAAEEVSYYLTMPMDAVAFSAVTINEMTDRGTTYDEVWRYLINETSIYSMIISENNTGVYCYYKGKYLDGSQWTPPDDYQPTERPWYTAAVAADGKITTVKPYLNLQTNTMMMSVCQLLDDGESVVSMDIFLDSVQQKTEELAASSIVESALMIDNDGFVVAHSDPDDVGKDYRTDGDAFEQLLAKNLKDHQNGSFSLSGDRGKCMVFSQQVNEDWNMVLIASDNGLFSSLTSIFLALILVLAAVIFTILAVFVHISRKHRESVRLGQEVLAIADIYVTVVQIDLKTEKMEIIRSNEDIEELLAGNYDDFSGRALSFAEQISSERSRNLLTKFMEPETLAARLADVNSISQEFMDVKGRWVRLRFIVVDRDEAGELHRILWAFESIDEDRKQQEKLRQLSETDMMTGIRNRGSGEALIRQKVAEGRQGMFILLDADDFKSVNDNFGHHVGDKVIIAIADALGKAFRDSDIVFRLGGDEFAVFAEGILEEALAKRVIDRFVENLDNTPLPELGERKITVSVGATFYTDTQNDTFEDIYRRADEGTYESKRHGKNHVSFYV